MAAPAVAEPAAGGQSDEARRDAGAQRVAAAPARPTHRRRAGPGARLERGTHRRTAPAGSDLMANFVLVHGAWHGGWCWRRVVDLLAREGHRAHAVTLTGVGERAHLLSP